MTAPLTMTVAQAVERIGPAVSASWIYKHLDEIPHNKTGNGTGKSGRVTFTEEHVAEIVRHLERRPSTGPAAGPEEFSSIATRRRSA